MILNQEDREQMIEIYFNKSVKAFKSCLSLCNDEEPDYDGSANRAYYSLFLAEKVLLLTKGIWGNSHKHTHMSISEKFEKEGDLPKGTYRHIKMVEGFRDIADYSEKRSVTKEELFESISEAKMFLEYAKKNILEIVPYVVAKSGYEDKKMQERVDRALKSLQPEISIYNISYPVEVKKEGKFIIASTEIDDTEIVVAITDKGELDKERSTLIDQYDHSDCDEINFKLQIIAENHLKSLEMAKTAEATRELPTELIEPPDEAAMAMQTPTPKKAVVPQKKSPAWDSGRGR